MSELEEFNFFHKQRSNKNGAGGVALFIRKSIPYEKINLFESINIEIFVIKILLNKKELIFISYYNPPDKTLSEKVFNTL